jgi:urease subunit alpha
MFATFGRALRSTSVTFVSKASAGKLAHLGLARPLMPVAKCRALSKRDMVNNSALPKVEVDPDTYEVRADGEVITCEPAQILPMAQRYFLF